jgi:hypothetical protein
MEHYRIRNTIYSYIGLAAALLLVGCQSDFCHVTGTASDMAVGDTLFVTSSLMIDSPKTAIIIEEEGQFSWEVQADSARLYRLWAAHHPDRDVTFFAERGSVSISMDNGKASVSGTHLNDEWQALNDMAADYSQRINRYISCHVTAGTPPSIITRRVTKLYDEMEQHISDVAERNKDNELGRFIHTHHK